MSTTRSILNATVGLQSASLLAANAKAAQKMTKMSPAKATKSLVKMGVTNIVGVGLIKPTADIINTID